MALGSNVGLGLSAHCDDRGAFGRPRLAIEALLMDTEKTDTCRTVTIGNGRITLLPARQWRILYAIAMMAAGWRGAPQKPAPGFPDDGS